MGWSPGVGALTSTEAIVTRRSYKQNPIHEALCEFRFDASGPWDPVVQGRFWLEFQKEYPGTPERRQVNTAAFHLGPATSGLILGAPAEQIRFPSADGRVMAIVGHNVLSVHSLRPYPGWEMFQPRIERALSLFCQIASPSGLSRIGLRYINRFEVGADHMPSEFLRCAPSDPLEPSTTLRSHAHRNEHLWPDGELLVVTHASAVAAEQRSLVLDLDVVHAWEGAPGAIDNAMTVVEHLHDREGAEFERLITDAARRVFDGDDA